mgnify:CR=1 FL=1
MNALTGLTSTNTVANPIKASTPLAIVQGEPILKHVDEHHANAKLGSAPGSVNKPKQSSFMFKQLSGDLETIGSTIFVLDP